jgi:hypothetical protein
MAARLRQPLESGLCKVSVERKRTTDTHLIHQDERNAIGERVPFVTALLEIHPARVKEGFIDMDYGYMRISQ